MIGPNLSEWSLKRPSFILFLMILSVAAGVLAFKDLGRDEDPPFTVRTMIVAAAWPGATVEETLQQVTERLERTLQETHKFDAVRSYTIAGQTTIFVDLDETTDTADIPDVWYRVRRNIGDIRGTLPAGVLGPFFNDDFGDTFGIIYGFTADGFSFRELRDYAEDIRSKLLQVPDVAKVEVLGAQDERIYIEFSNEKLAGLRLNLQSIIDTLQAQNVLRPSGVLNTEQERVYLRVSGAFDNERDIENVNIVMGERVIRLGDIAVVKRGFVDPPTPMFRVNGVPAIGLAISMRDQADILTLGKNIRTAMAEIRAGLPVGIEPHVVADQSTIVDVAINDFLTSLYQAIGIILLCSFVSLGVRPGIVVALAIPITLAIVFTVMNVMFIDLQRVSLGALIIALTLLVDDAMTTVDAMQRRLAAGDAPDAAASFAYRTLAAPMLIGTLVTIASFVPVGFAPGGASEVLSSLFSVVAISLIASWLVAVVFGPIIGKALLKPPAPVQGEPKPSKLKNGYQALLRGAIRMRWVTIGITVAMFAAAILALPLVPRQFFPSSDRPELLVDLTLRQNASIAASQATAERVEALLKGDPDVDHYSTYVGRGAIRFYLPLSVHLANPFFSQIVVIAKDIEARDRLQERLEKTLALEFPEVVAARVAAGDGSAGGLAAAVPRDRPRQGRAAPHRRGRRQADGRRHARASTSTTTGWSRRASCACTSTRTRRGGCASAPPTSPRCCRPRSPAPPSRRCATTSTWSTWSRARPTASAPASTRWRRCRWPRPAGAWCRCRSSRASPRSRSSRWCGAATACPRSPCAPTCSRACCPRAWWARSGRRSPNTTPSCRGPTGSRPAACTSRATTPAPTCSRSSR